MLKNKAQIARESIKKTPKSFQVSGPLNGPWIPAVREFGLRDRDDVRARTLIFSAAPLNENPGSAPV